MSVGARIKKLRLDRGWSQEDLARRLKVRQSLVSKWERAEAKPRPVNLLKTGKVFGVSVEFLSSGAAVRQQHKDKADALGFSETVLEIAEELNEYEKIHPGMASGFLLLLREGLLDTPEDAEDLLSLVEIFRERARRGTL